MAFPIPQIGKEGERENFPFRLAACSGLFVKLWIKALLFYPAFLVGIMLIPKIAAVAGISSGQGEAGLGFGWVFVFAISQFFIFQCPHCKQFAFITPEGGGTVWIGTRCRHCGKPY